MEQETVKELKDINIKLERDMMNGKRRLNQFASNVHLQAMPSHVLHLGKRCNVRNGSRLAMNTINLN